MRQLISILTISLFAATQLFAQEKYTTDYKVQYKTTYHQDSLHLDQTDSDDLYLFTGTNFGLFMNYDVIDREKTIEKMKRKFGGDAVSMISMLPIHLQIRVSIKHFTKIYNPGRW